MQTSGKARVSDLDWIVLSLERTPERLARFQADSARLGLPIETVAATDGRETNPQELAELGLIVPGRMNGWDADSVGNALSHWLCWHQTIESERPTCIFEDDAFLRGDFVERVLGLLDELPPDWDLLLLGYNTNSTIEVAITPDCYYRAHFARRNDSAEELASFAAADGAVVAMRLHHAFGSFAYLVSPAGAQKLIDGCFPLAGRYVSVPALGADIRATTLDGIMNAVFATTQAYAAFPPLALPFGGEKRASAWALPPTKEGQIQT